MKVLYCASECVPFIKTGGLADVAGSLPIALSKAGAEARVLLPNYRAIDASWKKRMEHVCAFSVPFGYASVPCAVERIVLSGVIYYLIGSEAYFDADDIYGDGAAEGERFAFFCKAVLEALPHIGFFPDVLHLNDWQTGLVPALLKTQYAGDPRYARVKTLFSIHNLRYQGLFDYTVLNARLGFDARYFTQEFLEYYGMLSFMKGGLVFSDRISTVSPRYAGEIQTPYYGEGLDGLLRARAGALSGILNGIDTEMFDPACDPFLSVAYSADDLAGKATLKTQLQAECGLADAPDVPIAAMIARLTPQKGLDLVERVLTDILRQRVQLVFLGSGDKHFVDMLNWAQWRYPGRVAFRAGLNESLAHRIYAGADLFLMPSQFEPCGLSQMIALRYGTLPVVRETGGLADSVLPYNCVTGEGDGFSFANYNAHELLFTLERAVRLYETEPEVWARLVQSGMRKDFGWAKSAGEYLALYSELAGKKRKKG